MTIRPLPARPRRPLAIDESTTEQDAPAWTPLARGGEDCLVIIHAADRANLGRRFVLLPSMGALTIGRDARCQLFLDGGAVSRQHARLEPRADGWWISDLCSRNGTYVNYERVDAHRLARGDQLKIGDAIFKFLAGDDVERLYHEEIYRLMSVDALTEAYNARHLAAELDREIARARRHARPLALIRLDLDRFAALGEAFGQVSVQHVLREVATIVRGRIRRDELFARWGTAEEAFAIVVPETPAAGARVLAEQLCGLVRAHRFVFEGATIPVTLACGVAELDATVDRAEAFVARAEQALHEARRAGGDRVAGGEAG